MARKEDSYYRGPTLKKKKERKREREKERKKERKKGRKEEQINRLIVRQNH